MNVLERIRSRFWSYRLPEKCRRNKLYCKMERERETERNRDWRERETDRERETERERGERQRVKGRGPESITRKS